MVALTQNNFGTIGGTTVSAIVGMNPWESAHGAYLKLRKEVPDTPDNAAMARGRRWEPVVANVFQGGHPEFIVKHNRLGTDEPERYTHEEFPFLGGHPDRLLYCASTDNLLEGLEIKTASRHNMRQYGEEGTDAIPQHYLIQCQWYAGLAKLDVWRLAVAFFDGNDSFSSYREYVIQADNELFDTLVARAVDFWENNVLKGNPPQIDYIDDTTSRWIKEHYSRNVAPMRQANEEEEALLVEYLQRKQRLAIAQKELEQTEIAIKLAIGENDGLTSDKLGRVSWKRSKDSARVDYKAVCDALNPSEELLKEHTKLVEGSRRFVTTGLKMVVPSDEEALLEQDEA